MKTKHCNKCDRFIKNCNYERHFPVCKGQNPPRLIDSYKVDGGYKCPYCDKISSNRGIGSHIWRSHTDAGRNFKIDRTKGTTPWNKGLTKDTDVRVQRYAQSIKDVYKTKPGSFTGLKHSDATKEKISKARIQYLTDNPDKVPYIINHASKKSYPEQVFEAALLENGIDGWVYNFRFGIYQYDFAWPALKIDIEIDGGTHNTDKVKKIDKRRDEFSIKNGWIVLRFNAEIVKKNVTNCINIIKKTISEQLKSRS